MGFQIDFEIQELFVIPEYLEISDHRDDKCEATGKYGTDKFETTRLYCLEQVSESETFLSKYIWNDMEICKEIYRNVKRDM